MSERPPTKYALIWGADIRPPTRKLVLLAMADFSDADGSNVRPSVETVANKCGLWPQQCRVHIQALRAEGLLIQEKGRSRWGPTLYRINLESLKERQETSGLATSIERQETSAFKNQRPLVSMRKTAGFHAQERQKTSDNPRDPEHPSVQGRGETSPSGMAPAGPTLGAGVVDLPPGLSKETFEGLVAQGNDNPARRNALVKKAWELKAGGHDPEALAASAVRIGLRDFADPAKTKPVRLNKSAKSKLPPKRNPGRETRNADYSGLEKRRSQ